MARFGGNEFIGFSVPLIFEGRYFVMEPGNLPQITVFSERDGSPVFAILKNRPVVNDVTDVSINATGIITVSQKGGLFLYKVRPDSESSIAFGALKGEEITARITDRRIQVGGITLENNSFVGNMAGVVVRRDDCVSIGSPIPQLVMQWLSSR